MTKLYHRDVFMPESVKAALRGFRTRLTWGPHAQRAFTTDRYRLPDAGQPPAAVDGAECEPIEAEVDSAGAVVKAVLRKPFSSRIDIVLVVQANGFVRTVWGNTKADQHRTLDKSRYATD